MQRFKVAGYIRLSKEDKIKDESNSVTNQKLIITSYIEKNEDLKLFDFYIDDGYSGTTFDRPEYKRMFKDIVDGQVNTVIVKDLSRFGRNHIQSDDYIENILPGYNVRFISIIDEIDSIKNPKSVSSIAVPLKNLMNDQYARNISEKVRSTLKIKQLNGEFIGVTAPYGYLKNPKDKHKFIIDKEASYIVKKIFNMILLGKSRKEIAEHLNNKNVLTPSLYKLSNENKNNEDLIRSKKWNAEIVNRILRNETYTGTLIQNIKTKPNYRTDKLIDVNKDEWIKLANHHEPIISKDKFEEVQNILDKKKGSRNSEDILLSYLKCADCGSQLYLKNGKNKKYYYCKNYIKHSKCTSHSVEREKLYNEVLQIINENKGLNITDKELNDSLLYRLIDVIYINEDKSVKIIFK